MSPWLFVAVMFAAGAAPKPARVAVLETRATGDVDARMVSVFDQSLVPELRKLEGLSVVSSVEIRDMLSAERQKQLLGCSDDGSACLAEMAGALDADELVTIDLGLVGSSYTLATKRFDLRVMRVVSSDLRKLEKSDGEELLASIGPVVAALYPDRPLKAGKERGVAEAVIRRLHPPPLPRWVFVATSAAAAVAGAGGVVFGLLMKDTEAQHRAILARSNVMSPADARDLGALESRAWSQATIANVLLATAGTLLLAAVIEAFFTDWRDERGALAALR